MMLTVMDSSSEFYSKGLHFMVLSRTSANNQNHTQKDWFKKLQYIYTMKYDAAVRKRIKL